MALPRLSNILKRSRAFMSGSKYAAGRRIDNVSVGKNGRVTAGGKHAWFNSDVGIIRKPLDK